MADNGTFIRVLIKAFSDKSLTSGFIADYWLPMNPEQFSQSYKVELDKSKPSGSAAPTLKYKSTAPEQLQFEFMFDGTGAIQDYRKELKNMTVRKQVHEFINHVYAFNGAIHSPKFLKISWGENGFTHQQDLSFDCIVSSLDIKYVLFDRSGEPLRAKVNATFLRYIEQKKEGKLSDKNSPDLTHVRTAKEGDRLPLMAYKIYSDQSFYLKVARANNLTTFRKLKGGSEIFFPPIDKES